MSLNCSTLVPAPHSPFAAHWHSLQDFGLHCSTICKDLGACAFAEYMSSCTLHSPFVAHRLVETWLLAAIKQFYEWPCPYVPSHIYIDSVIVSSWDFQEQFTFGKSDFHAKGQGQRRKVKVAHRGQSKIVIQYGYEIMLKASSGIEEVPALLYFKIICPISRWHGPKTRQLYLGVNISGW